MDYKTHLPPTNYTWTLAEPQELHRPKTGGHRAAAAAANSRLSVPLNCRQAPADPREITWHLISIPFSSVGTIQSNPITSHASTDAGLAAPLCYLPDCKASRGNLVVLNQFGFSSNCAFSCNCKCFSSFHVNRSRSRSRRLQIGPMYWRSFLSSAYEMDHYIDVIQESGTCIARVLMNKMLHATIRARNRRRWQYHVRRCCTAQTTLAMVRHRCSIVDQCGSRALLKHTPTH